MRTTLRPVLEALDERPTPKQILDLKVCDPAMGSGAFLVESCRQLAERLVTAWEVHDAMPEMPPDEEPLLHARRLVAQRCLYGVDKNPFAVSLAKLSIWLVTLAKDHAFTFIDHALKHGDSLVGLTRKQITSFHWNTGSGQAMDLFESKLKEDIQQVLGWRNAMQGFGEGDYNQKKEVWWKAEHALADARLIGDLVVAGYFGAEKDKDREALRNQYRSKVEAWLRDAAHRHELEDIVQELRSGPKPVPPMHWEIEFPEVFGKEHSGFDAIVGNPHFLGGSKITRAFGDTYREFLSSRLAGHKRGKADLVAYFVIASFGRLKSNGTIGMVVTTSLAEGDSRAVCLDELATAQPEPATIYAVYPTREWPGAATVTVACAWIFKGVWNGRCQIDGEEVSRSGLTSRKFPLLCQSQFP